jgi:hypothetical protein
MGDIGGAPGVGPAAPTWQLTVEIADVKAYKHIYANDFRFTR